MTLLEVGLWIVIGACLLYLVLEPVWEWRQIRQTDRFIEQTQAYLDKLSDHEK